MSEPNRPEGATGGARADRSFLDRAPPGDLRQSLARAHRYSRFVRFMKGVLPLAALGVGGAVLFYGRQGGDSERYALTFERMSRVKDDLTMVHPRLTGSDSSGTPFVVTADSAVQEDTKGLRVRLFDVRGNTTLADGSALELVAAEGLLDAKAHTLVLSKGLRLMTTDGYDIQTQSATIDLQKGVATGHSRVEVRGPIGQLQADRFRAEKQHNLISFAGHVHMLLRPMVDGESAG